jgi:TRAP-type C4-dicarboxylate transport system permease small subunit
MFANVLDAVLRWLDRPIYGVFEMNGLLVGIMIFLGLALTQQRKKHISVSLVSGRLPALARHIIALIPSITGVVFFTWLTYLYGLRAYDSFVASEVIPGIVKIPIFPLKFSMVLGIGLLTIQLIIDVVMEVRTLFKPPAEPTKEKSTLKKEGSGQ